MGDVPMKKMAANKALQAIGAKARLSLNADVRKEYMKIRLAADAA